MSADCVFCKIISGEIPSDKLLENEWVIAIRDINPAARVHVLVMPKKHIRNILEVVEADERYILEVHKAIRELAVQTGIAADGFRVINNCGKHGGQTVDHLHYHLIGGQCLGAKLLG